MPLEMHIDLISSAVDRLQTVRTRRREKGEEAAGHSSSDQRACCYVKNCAVWLGTMFTLGVGDGIRDTAFDGSEQIGIN